MPTIPTLIQIPGAPAGNISGGLWIWLALIVVIGAVATVLLTALAGWLTMPRHTPRPGGTPTSGAELPPSRASVTTAA